MRLLLVTYALFLVACLGCSRTEKQFPMGEPDAFEESTRIAEEYDESDQTETGGRKISIPSNKAEAQGLRLNAEVPAPRVPAGTPIRVRMVLRNTTNNTLPVNYTSAQRFDVAVFKDRLQEEPVYVWSQGQFFAQIFTDRMLSGGATITDTIDVPTTADPASNELLPDNLTRPLTPGTYYLWVTHAGDPFLADGPIEIIVQKRE